MAPISEQARHRALSLISNCDDAAKLRTIVENAVRAGDHAVAVAGRRKLYSVLPSAMPGTLEHDVWSSIFALEDALSQERGKTIRLARTRQKIARDGEYKTVEALVVGKETSGFQMLMEREMEDLTFEAVALRHADQFSPETLAAARSRLDAACDSSEKP